MALWLGILQFNHLFFLESFSSSVRKSLCQVAKVNGDSVGDIRSAVNLQGNEFDCEG